MKKHLTAILEKVQGFPKDPGVYLMKDEGRHIIYVGKAKNLKNRVRQYFSDHDARYQVRFLMERVHDIDFLQTKTEREALLLENSLIKKHKPKYNLFLKDDKTYLGLKLTIKDDFPRLYETRRIKKDGAAYYGPFTSAETLREVKEFIDRHFLLRTCSDHEFNARTRPCLEYQIKRCSAPCVKYVSKDEYAEQIRAVKLFLEGQSRDLQKLVKVRMEKASTDLNFEEAARLRDLLGHMEDILERQNVMALSFEFLDIIALRRRKDKIGIAVLMVREAKLIDSRYFVFSSLEDDEDVLENFITQYYSEEAFIPKEIVVPLTLTGQDVLQSLLSDRSRRKISLRIPKKGEKHQLLELAEKNLMSHFDKADQKDQDKEKILATLQQKLNLSKLPRRMECYDNSHLSGKQAVGSLVCFVDGQPFKDGYRRFKIQSAETQNDFAMMFEVLKRRFTQKNDTKWPCPDLIVIDGGKGQLSLALKALEELNLTDLDVVAIAKGQGEGARAKGLWEGKKEEEIYLPHRKNPVILRRGSAELMLLQRLRDESHRFAITYHRKLREKELTHSWLDEVPGIGAKRKQALLKTFGSPQAVAEADHETLLAVPGMTESTVKALLSLHRF